MKRLNTDKSIAPVVAQFVPVKLDIASADYQEWRKDYQHEGKTIPILFVVRADGESLYGKSGSLSGDALPAMLVRALENSGRILGVKEIETLTKAKTSFEELTETGDVPKAIKALNRVSRIGTPGLIQSYAQSAAEINVLAGTTAKDVLAKLAESKKLIESTETAKQLDGILSSLKLQREYSGLKILKPELSKFQKELGKNKPLSQLLSEAKIINSAIAASSKTATARAKTKLETLIQSTKIESVKTLAQSTLGGLAD